MGRRGRNKKGTRGEEAGKGGGRTEKKIGNG